MSPSVPQRSLKRKSNPIEFEDSGEKNSQSFLEDDTELSTDSSPRKSWWSPYYEIFERISEYSQEVRTTEECVTATRIADITYVKLAQEIQKIDLSTINHWDHISSILIRKWDELFSVPENNGLTFSDIVPINRYRANYFGTKSSLINRKGGQEDKQKQKKTRNTKKKDNSQAKVCKPLEGTSSDKPSTLVAHMEVVLDAIANNYDDTGTVNYLRLVTDPHSFSSTVYNIFTMSFLIRDNQVAISIGKNRELRVKLCSAPTNNQKQRDQEKKHFMINITNREWKKLIKHLNIRTALITPPEKGADDDHFSERFQMSQKMKGKKKRIVEEEED